MTGQTGPFSLSFKLDEVYKSVAVLDDTIVEGTETFLIELRSSDPGIVIVEPAQVVVEIKDDDDSGKIKRFLLENIHHVYLKVKKLG